MEQTDFMEPSPQATGVAMQEQNEAKTDFDQMFSVAEFEEQRSEMMSEWDFSQVARDIGLTQQQVAGIKDLEKTTDINVLSLDRFCKEFTNAAKKLGISASQIRSLLDFDKKNNWE